MGLFINTNVSALGAVRNLNKTGDALASATERLTTGSKINRAADNAAGLAISTRMTALLGGLEQSIDNANAGISLLNTADGALNAISHVLLNLRSLAVQSANGTLTTGDRLAININATSLLAQIDSVVNQTSFNGLNLLNGTLNTTLQVGANAGDTITLTANSVNTAEIGGIFVHGTATTTGIAGGGDLVIDGITVNASTADGVSSVSQNTSAIAVAAAINASGADVIAVINPTVTGLTPATAANTSGTMTINGFNTAIIDATGTLATDTQLAITAINALTSKTGVVASADPASSRLLLSAHDGRNIAVSYTGAGFNEANFGSVTGGTTTHGTVTLSSSNPIIIAGTDPTGAGLVVGTTSQLTALSSIDLSTQSGSITSLAVIDGAIDAVSSLLGNLGAVQNRLESAADTLSNSAVNLQAAKAEILDTDYATEMTSFTKLQILQQAGTAMLSQANQQPVAALKLLQGQ